jgi:hypothetical protein
LRPADNRKFFDSSKRPIAADRIGLLVASGQLKQALEQGPMKRAVGQTLAAFVGGVSYFLSQGFSIPNGAEGFKFLAVFAAVSGFGIGNIFAARARPYSLDQATQAAILSRMS